MRRSIEMTLALALLAASACKKSEESKQPEPSPTGSPGATADPSTPPPTDQAAPAGDVAADVGVTAGGIERAADEGPAAVLAAVTGTIEVRRVGEPAFAAAKAETKLYPGDTVRAGEASTATIALADESVIELAEVSTVAIASREGTADPASAAAVLAGLARFTVTPRAPGEGAFRVYTPAGVVLTRGTVYGVGVAASGQVRVGVESGSVDVLGLSALDAEPVAVEGNSAVTFTGAAPGAPAPWAEDDWGTWRAEADASVDIATAVDAHADAMAQLGRWLADAYADLTAAADAVATFEASAAASADAGDTAAYEASLPDGAASIDASFAVAGRLEALTWANAARAELATDLYVRHPDVVGPRWEPVAPRVDAAVLWPKRFEISAAGYLQPVRGQYYVHHPRGRVHAELVGITVPAFYAQVTPPAIDVGRVRARVRTKVWAAPELQYSASARPVWVAAPAVDWRAGVKIAPAPMRANVGWYVRPPSLKAKVMLGGDVRGRWKSRLVVKAPEPRARLRAAWKVPVGVKIKVGAPNLAAGAKARAGWRVGVGGPPGVRAGVKAKAGVGVRVPDVRAGVGVRVPAVKAGVGATVRDHRAGAGAKVKAGIGVKVKAPAIKLKAPSVKVKAKGEIKGGFKIGR